MIIMSNCSILEENHNNFTKH